MTTNVGIPRSSISTDRPDRRLIAFVCTAILAAGLSGCAAMRPLRGVDAGELPDEFRDPQRSVKTMVDLSLLRRTPPREHIVDADDVLSIYVEGFLGGDRATLPSHMQQIPNARSSLGYPIRVRGDGTISLPQVQPIEVRGMTIRQVERAVRNAYTKGEKPPIVAGAERVFVDLHRPRHYRVLVMRQEAGGRNSVAGAVGRTQIEQNRDKRGTGRVVSLPAYQNDVLHALAETGGLPGLDAENVIYVIRNHRRNPSAQTAAPSIMPRFASPTPPAPISIHAPAPNAREVAPSEKTEPEQTKTEPTSIWDLSNRRARRSRNQIQLASAQSPVESPTSHSGGHSPLPPITTSSSKRPPLANRTSPVYSGRSGEMPRRSAMRVPTVSHSNEIYYPYNRGPVYQHATPADSGMVWPAVNDLAMLGTNVIRIPLRLIPGEIPAITEEDITLYDGDVVLIESRETDVFFTGGLLGGGRFTLPRDQDLDVLQALAIVQSQPVRSYPSRAIGGPSATNQDVTVGASNLMILRQRADGSQISIRVNLYKAMRDPTERILVQPGDHLILQYTRMEAFGAFFERHILEGAILGGSSGIFFGN